MSIPELINKPEEGLEKPTEPTPDLGLMVAHSAPPSMMEHQQQHLHETQQLPDENAPPPPPPDMLNEGVDNMVNYDEGKGVKKRKKKDPKAPRRPLSAYNIFFKAVREEIHSSSNDRPSFSGLVQLVSQRWRETTPENKTKFEIQAKADYQRYADEMAQYRQRPEVQSVLVDPAANGSKRRCKFLGVSKRPLSGYNIFFREEHARLKKLKAETDDDVALACMTVTIAKKWSELSEAEKSELNKRAAETQRQAEEAEAQRELQRKAASMKNSQVFPQGYGPQGAHPALLAHYHDYYAARLQQMSQAQPREANFAGTPGVVGGAMPPTEPPKDGDGSAQANWDAILKQQQEQHFQQQYMQWCFEQIQQQQQLGQWQQYQQQQGQQPQPPPPDQQQQHHHQQQQQQQQQIQEQQQQQQQHQHVQEQQQMMHQQQLQQQQQQQQQMMQQQQLQQQMMQQQQLQQQQQQQQQHQQQQQQLDMHSVNNMNTGESASSPPSQYLDPSSFQ